MGYQRVSFLGGTWKPLEQPDLMCQTVVHSFEFEIVCRTHIWDVRPPFETESRNPDWAGFKAMHSLMKYVLRLQVSATGMILWAMVAGEAIC